MGTWLSAQAPWRTSPPHSEDISELTSAAMGRSADHMHAPAILAAILTLLATAAHATDYYVKNGGNDGANGQSLGSAWATLQHAADVVNPGDTVHVQDGSYAGFYLERSGSAGNPITFLAAGANVQISADNGTTPDGINIENASYVVIDGFIVNNRTRAGIRTALSSFVTVRNCRCGYNGGWGIFSGHAYDFTIENNETHHSVAEHGIYVSNSGDRPIIRGNISHHNYANGIHMNGDASQGEDGIISEALVEANIIYENGTAGGSGINMDGVSNSVVRNNLLYDNHASGISLYQIDGATGSTGNLVINNTIVNAANARWCLNINNGSSGNTVRNNVLYNYHSFRGVITIDASSRPGFSSDYNTVMSRFSIDDGATVISLASWQALGYDAHSIIATPAQLFVVPASDFHLSETSPALDAGTAANAPSVDVEGSPRPAGAGYDIGAYERQLLACGDGGVDPGEQCGEPGLTCTDACTSCSDCTCVPNAAVCGDGLVCGSEECETDSDCSGGQSCGACQCINPPLCESGITIERGVLRLVATPFFLRARGQAVIPKPWTGVDPLNNGIRIRIDATAGSGGVDITVPGGLGWSTNSRGTAWVYTDRTGSIGGVTRVTLKDRSAHTDGLLSWSLKAGGGTASLPSTANARTAVVLGAANECAQIAWNPPSASRPRCSGDSDKLSCR